MYVSSANVRAAATVLAETRYIQSPSISCVTLVKPLNLYSRIFPFFQLSRSDPPFARRIESATVENRADFLSVGKIRGLAQIPIADSKLWKSRSLAYFHSASFAYFPNQPIADLPLYIYTYQFFHLSNFHLYPYVSHIPAFFTRFLRQGFTSCKNIYLSRVRSRNSQFSRLPIESDNAKKRGIFDEEHSTLSLCFHSTF